MATLQESFRETIAGVEGTPKEVAEQPRADEYSEFPITQAGEDSRTEDYEEFPLAEAGPVEKVAAIGQGANAAFAEMAPIPAGMMMGAGLGALGGPAAPVTVPLGAALGGAAGYFAGQGAKHFVEESPLGRPIKDMPADVKPFGIGGEVIGGSLAFGAATHAIANAGLRLPPSKVGNFINRMFDFAAKEPGTFAAAETAGAIGAGLAGGVSESFLPGQVGPRLAAEVVGGFFNPTRLLIGASKSTIGIVKNVFQSMTPAGRETAAARILQDLVAESGEDPTLLADLLRASDLPGIERTAAQKTASPALIALEAKLSADSAKFGSEARKIAEDSMESIRGMITALRGTGDPGAMAAAADLRSRYFRTLLTGRVQTAEREAVEAAARITRDTPAARAALSEQANQSLRGALDDARTAENELWAAIPREAEANAGGLLERYDAIRADLLPEEALPTVVEGFITRMREVQGITNAGELLRFRSRSLTLAREASSQGKFNDARIYGELAESALDDLSGIAGGEAITEARTFSRELHDTFTRTFAGESMRTTGRGGARIPPELMLSRALATGKDAGNLRLQELEEATRFVVTRGLGGPEAVQNLDVMLDAQQRLVSLAAADAINPATGRISVTRLTRFLRDNETLLDRFPEVRTGIQEALTAEVGLTNLQNMATGARSAIESQTAFAKIAKVENPADAIRAALTGKNPVGDLASFSKLAKRGGVDAVDGLRATVFDHAIRQSSDAEGVISFDKLRAALFNPVRPNQPSLAKLMQRDGILTEQQVDQAAKLLSEGRKIESALQKGDAAFEDIMNNTTPLLDVVLRTAGSKGAHLMGGDTLIAQSAGSKFVRRMFEKANMRPEEVLKEAMKNPRMAAALLERPKTQAEGITIARQVHAYLIQAGVVGLTDSTEQTKEPRQ